MPKSMAVGKTLEELDVVLVNDNKGSQGILRSMVSHMRIARLRAYERAEKALHDMMVDPPNVVVTDWRMKPMSGYRLVRLIRRASMEPLCFVPILAVTPMPTMSMVDRAFTIGVNNIIVLPIAPVVLRRRLEWLQFDSREFILDGDNYVLDGMEEILEERVRRNDVTALLRRHTEMQEALVRRAENAQGLVDRIVSGEDGDGPENALVPIGTPSPEKRRSSWNSWTMS